MAIAIVKKQINQTSRPKLTKVLEQADCCYLLDGELAKSKKADVGSLTVLAEYGERWEIIIDSPICGDEEEYFRKMSLSDKAINNICEILGKKVELPKRKESTGRPKKYGIAEAQEARKLKAEGLSIRKIAEKMGASTYTVQTLLNSMTAAKYAAKQKARRLQHKATN